MDVAAIGVAELKELVMRILQTQSFEETLYVFGIKDIIPPNIKAAKQTQTTQRFKVHLISAAGEDLFTKIEFSRRGFMGKVIAETVPAIILRNYRLTPLIWENRNPSCFGNLEEFKDTTLKNVIQLQFFCNFY